MSEKNMIRTVLHDKKGNDITWLNATIEASKIIGRPANVEEIYKVMLRDVITDVPATAKTPTQTIYGQIYTHSHDSKAGTDKENFFYSAGVKGIWGLVDNSTARLDVGMTEDDAGFREGKAVLEVHLHRERNANLIKKAKQKFQEEHEGHLFCEACGFNFCEIYGEIGNGYIEAHHLIKPISIMREGDATRIEDLAMLCANCHRMVHRIRPWIFDRNKLKEIVRHI